MAIAIVVFLLVLVLRFIAPAPTSSRRGERHVTFALEPTITITQPHSAPSTPTLSLTATPRELEPPTPDVAEDPLRALSRICGFLASNTARAWKRDELGATPPLAGLEPYLDAVRVDLARIDEMVEEGRQERQGEHGERAPAEGSDRKDTEVGVPGIGADAGVDAGAGADARNEPGLVANPHQATHADPLPSLQSQFPTPPSPHPSTSTTTPSAAPAPSTDNAYLPPRPPMLTIATSNPRRRKDAVLRATRPVLADPDHADADADDAAVRAAALLSRFADLGAGLEGTVRERGAALWTALSRSGRSSPPDLPLPVPPLPRNRASAALIAAPPDLSVVEASRVVAHQAAWRARFATYGRLFGPAAEQR
jgi:hypothetical protein